MTIKVSVKQAQKHIDLLTRDRDTRLTALQAQIDAARKKNLSTQAAQLTTQYDMLNNTYAISLERAGKVLQTAKEDEAQEATVLEGRRQVKETALKEKTRTIWIQAGGDPSQFDAVWPTLQSSILTETVTQKMTT